MSPGVDACTTAYWVYWVHWVYYLAQAQATTADWGNQVIKLRASPAKATMELL
jgi:hypothetical protein